MTGFWKARRSDWKGFNCSHLSTARWGEGRGRISRCALKRLTLGGVHTQWVSGAGTTVGNFVCSSGCGRCRIPDRLDRRVGRRVAHGGMTDGQAKRRVKLHSVGESEHPDNGGESGIEGGRGRGVRLIYRLEAISHDCMYMRTYHLPVSPSPAWTQALRRICIRGPGLQSSRQLRRRQLVRTRGPGSCQMLG